MELNNGFDMFDSHESGLPQLKVIIEHDIAELPILCLNAQDSVRNLAYSESEVGEEEDEFLLVNDQTIEKGYVFVANAYRGEGVYNAVLKVDGKWWDCDVVSEGVAYEIVLSDEEVEQLISAYQALDSDE